MFRVNTTGPLLGIQALTPHYTVAYTASKWAVRGLAKVASLELGPLGIRSNLVHPGYIETPMVANAPETFRRAQLEANPLGIVGAPEDVANLIVFLISDESRYISGAEIVVDGGFTSQAGVKFLSDAVRGAAPADTARS